MNGEPDEQDWRGALLPDSSLLNLIKRANSETESSNDELLMVDFDPEMITPVGYDLRVGPDCYFMRYRLLRSGITKVKGLKPGEELKIPPHTVAAIRTLESVCMPRNAWYSGLIVSKVSTGEKGLSHISTSLDWDWRGPMLVTVTNNTGKVVKLEQGKPFCTMVLFRNAQKAATNKVSLKTYEGHLLTLKTEWEDFAKEKKSRDAVFWLLKATATALPMLPLLIKYLNEGASSLNAAEVALLVTVSGAVFQTLDRTVLRTD